jgi:RecJ-like exonuclease
VSALADRVGAAVTLEGEVVQINQTGGPTVFSLRDETGIAPCTAFEAAGVRSHPDIAVGDVVAVSGTVEEHDGSAQVEIESLDALEGEEATAVEGRLAAALDDSAAPHSVEPLVEWAGLAKHFPDLERVAEIVRRAVLEGRPVRVRYHADGDGMCSAVPVERAVRRFVENVHVDPEASRHLFRRSPSRAPYYELDDVVRDLSFSLGDRDRYGQKLPLVVLLDNGSTAEDAPAYRTLAAYDIPVVAIDHHHPDPEVVEEHLAAHINPYLHDEDYAVTTGMLAVELARMIDPSLTEELRHVPAVAGLADRSDAEAMDEYVALAEEAGYEEADLRQIGDALDYSSHWLRYGPGRHLLDDVLGVGEADPDRHRRLVSFLAERAERDVETQLDAVMTHVETETLANDVPCHRIDLDQYAHRFTYPAPGKTTSAIHDRRVEADGQPAITIGYGPDFAVLRSDGVRMDFPEIVGDLRSEIEGAGISGGGHLVVGSLSFVPGKREAVLEGLFEKLGEAPVDEAIGSSAAMAED